MAKSEWLYWISRIVAILYALFVSLFALDVLGKGHSFFELLTALFMHLIPAFVLIIIIVIAWKKEIIGGALFIALGLFYVTAAYGKFSIGTYFIIAGPPIAIGVLFLAAGLKVKKKCT
jgi:hypothetical protein